ncbi:MAG: UDP-3-O-(3-hydroxymyristoyl)glucosamine N-acyltransferase [Phycisphaerae bacterium]
MFTVGSIAAHVGGRLEGDASVEVDGIAPIEQAGPTDLTFAANAKYARQLDSSSAGAAIVGPDVGEVSADMPVIRVDRIEPVVAGILEMIGEPCDLPAEGIDASARIDPSADIADAVRIGPNVIVGANVTIGRGSMLQAGVCVNAGCRIGEECLLSENVVLKAGTQIGSHVRIGPGSVLGWDGFGYYHADGVHHRYPHVGKVVVEDHVDIGANVCIDRAKFGITRIGAGTKIDNLVQIAHNVDIGKACILVGQCGVAGSVKLGNGVMLGGACGIRDHLSMGDGSALAGLSALARDVEPGEKLAGMPAVPFRDFMKLGKAQAKLPALVKTVRKLEERLEALESSKDN